MKTPEEKAKELVDRFLTDIDFSGVDLTNDIKQAKTIALICVNEIMKEYEKPFVFDFPFTDIQVKHVSDKVMKRYEYLEEVKQEINKI